MAAYNPHAPDWHKVAPSDITLAEYAKAWIDMEPHIGELAVYARGKKTIVEFGLRGAVSTWAMLDAMPEDGHLIGIDIDPNANILDRVRNDPRFYFLNGDAQHCDQFLPFEHADLVMIDAGHEFAETVIELMQAARLNPDVILLHDYLYPETPGVRLAIDGYTAKGYLRDEPYRLEVVHPSRWGLAVLVRR